jgi:hypothetical protein
MNEEEFQEKELQREREKRKKKRDLKKQIESNKGKIVDLDISSSDFSSSGDEENFLESVCLRLLK